MIEQKRAEIYGLIALIFEKPLSQEILEAIKNNQKLLSEIGKESLDWFNTKDLKELKDELDNDFINLFEEKKPIESLFLNQKEDGVSFQNKTMAFYYKHNYQIDFSKASIKSPDHITVECNFMQRLILDNNYKLQMEFLKNYISSWFLSYLKSQKARAKTPFYREFFDFVDEFISYEVELLTKINQQL